VKISKVAWSVAGRRLTAAAGSVTGERYDANYDVLHLDPARPLAVVADGMGDGRGSALAGRTAVDVFATAVTAPSTPTAPAASTSSGMPSAAAVPTGSSSAGRDAVPAPTPAALRAATAQVHHAVRRAGRDLTELTGCTLTAFVAAPGDPEPAAWIVQLGDSRAYRLRDGLLDLLTVDHTVAWLGLLHGWFTAGSAEAQAARYRLTRYAGHPEAPEPDVLNVALHPGDVLLLCTDGVADQLTYESLTQTLSAAPDPAEAVALLLDATLTAGGADNATAVVIRVEQTI
jgi:PPM family protein phosphatase